MDKRSSGILMHITSLPGSYGLGAMGREAYDFIDFLAAAGQQYWQVLPVGPTGYGNSPYQSPSSFAGNPDLIDLALLSEQGLIDKSWLDGMDFGQDPDRADFDKQAAPRQAALRAAHAAGRETLKNQLGGFRRDNAHWLEHYALFAALSEHFNGLPARQWPDPAIVRREPEALRVYEQTLSEQIDFHIFVQYLFYCQWSALRKYAGSRGVKIIGDIPIYVSPDSVETWVSPKLFMTDEAGRFTHVAGVPPDAYSETGQLWGNPLYNWKYHKKTRYAWWTARLRHMLRLFDAVRIDHFRGFESFWSVKSGAETALEGRWRKGPGMDFVRAVKKALPDALLIAEDLGDLDEAARAFFAEAGFPGMSVLVHAFDPDRDSLYLPHNIPENNVAYTSTHDSETFVQWLSETASERQRKFALSYLRLREDEGLAWGAVKAIWGSPASIAIAPLQDILGLGGDARMNIPGTVGGKNWRWRVRGDALNATVAETLREITQTYRRL